mmetsp:Transcript_18305/g.32803  ORF Transcript_18305/g.32803 Transcript_18305/m.32803 type:complete len:135 (-) Transcript_18305:133-537(-)
MLAQITTYKNYAIDPRDLLRAGARVRLNDDGLAFLAAGPGWVLVVRDNDVDLALLFIVVECEHTDPDRPHLAWDRICDQPSVTMLSTPLETGSGGRRERGMRALRAAAGSLAAGRGLPPRPEAIVPLSYLSGYF